MQQLNASQISDVAGGLTDTRVLPRPLPAPIEPIHRIVDPVGGGIPSFGVSTGAVGGSHFDLRQNMYV